MSRVDVVIPCYNYGRYLEACVMSILTQAGVDVRVLIIDDCSTDDSPVVGRRLAAQDSRVEFRRHDVNRGHIATYNEGLLGWAEAEYSVLLSADDALAPGALSRAADLLDSQPTVGLAYGMAVIICDGDWAELTRAENSHDQQVVAGRTFLQRCLDVGNPVPTPAAVVRTSAQKRLGGYRADLPHSGDMEMWMRFAADSDVGIVAAVQAYYRWHGGNMSASYYRKLLGDRQERISACREVVERFGDNALLGSFKAMCRRLARESVLAGSELFNIGDVQGCGECLSFALVTYPEIVREDVWKRLKAKHTLGWTAWRVLQPVASFLRGTGGRPLATTSPHTVGREIGWWP